MCITRKLNKYMQYVPGVEKEMATHSSILAWKSHGQRSLVGYSPWVQRVGHDWAHVQVAQWEKNPPANAGDAGDTGSMPELGRSPGGGNGNPVQYSCLGNPIDRRPAGLQSMGSQRVGHGWATECAHTVYMQPLKNEIDLNVLIWKPKVNLRGKSRL